MKIPPLRLTLTIGSKILLGYVPILVLIFGILIFTLLRLDLVNRINSEIVSVDIVVNRVAGDLIEILLAQESYGQRCMILRSHNMFSLFWKRDEEFLSACKEIRKLPVEKLPSSFPEIERLHSWYHAYFNDGVFSHLRTPGSRSYSIADSLRKHTLDQQITLLKELAVSSKKSQMDKTREAAELGSSTFRIVSIMSISGIIIAIFIALIIISGIIRSIRTLKMATDIVSQGNFKNLPTVIKRDELGDLSAAFNTMAARLVQLEEIYMDSSPLTRLPGGTAIENAVKKKIESSQPFAFCMFDLDNFKPFNDRYGYSRGNEVIKNTAAIIQECSRDAGNKADFIGHIGGDDFALITSPDRFEDICTAVIKKFDEQIVNYYNPEDREAGQISSVNRQGITMTFPIMTVSIAAVSSEKTYLENFIRVGEIIAELKKYAKSFCKSNLVIDRRGGKKKESMEKP
ncbi:MAG: GGDEF domain-containing protein [Chitinispirillaceae bacterium]|nr:GGDEF domain-containing protein [Chitinispirillaceae bacterium]